MRLPPALTGLRSSLRRSGLRPLEVLVCVDGSTDGTCEAVKAWSKNNPDLPVAVADLSRNAGKGGTLKVGFAEARGEALLMADADGATDWDEVGRFVGILRDDMKGVGAVIGSRAHLADGVKRTRFRAVLMRGFHFVVSVFGRTRVKDTQCGFKLFSAKEGKRLFSNVRLLRWSFDVEVLSLCTAMGVPHVEVPVRWEEVDGSKLAEEGLGWAAVRMLRDVVGMWACYGLGIWKVE